MLPITKGTEKPHKFGLWCVLPFCTHMKHFFNASGVGGEI